MAANTGSTEVLSRPQRQHPVTAIQRVTDLGDEILLPATAAGHASLLGWLGKFADVALVGVEGTGSYGAGLARHLAACGVRVVEVDRADGQDRRGSQATRRWVM